jgi:hypothetical protein
VADYLAQPQKIRLVRFVLFGRPTYEVYQKVMRELLGGYPGARLQ